MASNSRPKTPPQASETQGLQSRTPLTPEQVKKIEINRLKAKALRDQREAEARRQAASNETRPSGNLAAGQKRSYDAASRSETPATSRDATKPTGFRPLDDIQPARNFTKYVEYDFSKMTDTKGGFLNTDDDPFNKALKVSGAEDKPAHMTLKEWERLQLLKKLREQKSGPFQPGMMNQKDEETKICRECSSLEIDYKWDEIFGVAICESCKDKYPEKYSLLTKTEAKEDYLLTDPELKDEELLPHLEKPNPHKSNWHNMMLFLRCQVEEYAFSAKKWGSPEALDEAFEKRESEKKKRKQDKFKSKLQELKKRTRVEAYKRSRQAGSGGDFGDDMSKGGKHTHVWGRAVENEDGTSVKTCSECGMEVEELEF